MKYRINHERIDIIINQQFSSKSLADFLNHYYISEKTRNALLNKKNILINHVPVESFELVLNKHDTLSIITEEKEVDYPLADKECQVVYEDDFVYVAHKDAGIIIHDDESKDTLASQAALYQYNHNINAPVRYIHRLDKDTRGLVLFVKYPLFQPYFDEMLKQRKISRSYLAITTGSGKVGQKFTFNQKIGKDRHINNRYRVSKTGKEALTKATIIDKYRDYLLFECKLFTGRTHQIRVHLSNSRHPIVNDEIYGDPSADFKGMGLWANKLTFHNPLTDEEITVRDINNPDYRKFRNI